MKKLLRKMMLLMMIITLLFLPGVGLAQEDTTGAEGEGIQEDSEKESYEKTVFRRYRRQ